MPRRALCAVPLAPTVLAFCSELSPAAAEETVPSGTFKAVFFVKNLDGGSDGQFTVEVNPDWAPRGADRFKELVKEQFYNGARFFRVIDNFVAQFGVAADPAVSRIWRSRSIQDDKVKVTNSRGTMVFATSGPNSRTTQIFINFNDNTFLDQSGFSPFAKVVEGMDVVDKLYNGY